MECCRRSLALSALPPTQITPLIPLSHDSLNLSFAKYLDLRFNAVDLKNRTVATETDDGIILSCDEAALSVTISIMLEITKR